MNQLRQLTLEELRRRNFADTTIRTYLHGVAHFSRYFRRPPDQLGPEDIRKYQALSRPAKTTWIPSSPTPTKGLGEPTCCSIRPFSHPTLPNSARA